MQELARLGGNSLFKRGRTCRILGALRTVLTVWMEDGVQWGGNRPEQEALAEIEATLLTQ